MPVPVRASFVIAMAASSLVGCSRRPEAALVPAPKIELVNASPIAVAVGAPVRLTCSVAGTAAGVVSYRWQVSSTKPPFTETLEGIAVDCTAKTPGDYVATCTASNPSGSDIKSASFSVETPGRAGHPESTLPKSPIAVRLKCDPPRARGGEAVTCAAEVSGSNGAPRYEWTSSFGKFEGDGDHATLMTPSENPRGGQIAARVDVSVTSEGAAGNATAEVLVDVRACDKTTLEATATAAFAHEKPGADAGPPSADAKSATPADGAAACGDQVASCMKQTGKIDACVKSVTRCQSATPWRGDPSGVDCCPVACVESYFAHRREACAPELLETWLRDCYPGQPAR
jgi:hypothetical protein